MNTFKKNIIILSMLFFQFCGYQKVAQTIEDNGIEFYTAIESISTSIANNLNKFNINKIAIMDYTDVSGKKDLIGDYIVEEITLELFLKENFQIIEREQIDYAINEQKLTNSGLTDPNSAIKIGNILSADAIIIGTIVDIAKSIIINTKAISSETGEILFVNKTTIIKDKTFDSIINNEKNQSPSYDDKFDFFSNTDLKEAEILRNKLLDSLFNCLSNNNYDCFKQFLPTRDQFRKILIIKHNNDRITRKEKIKKINAELKKYKKHLRKKFNQVQKKINWNNFEIESINHEIIKNYDRKKMFKIYTTLNSDNEKIDLSLIVFKLNKNWIISEIRIK